MQRSRWRVPHTPVFWARERASGFEEHNKPCHIGTSSLAYSN